VSSLSRGDVKRAYDCDKKSYETVDMLPASHLAGRSQARCPMMLCTNCGVITMQIELIHVKASPGPSTHSEYTPCAVWGSQG
jgi:hypothetical protein